MAESERDKAARQTIARMAERYMATKMAMGEPLTDQHQNWIWGHMVDFGVSLASAPTLFRQRDELLAALKLKLDHAMFPRHCRWCNFIDRIEAEIAQERAE